MKLDKEKITQIIRELNNTKEVQSGEFDDRDKAKMVPSWFNEFDLADKVRDDLEVRFSKDDIIAFIESSNDKDMEDEYAIFKDKHQSNIIRLAIENKKMDIVMQMENLKNEAPIINFNIIKSEIDE